MSLKPSVLIVGDAVVPTGFSRVTHSIMVRLTERYSFHQLGVNYRGDPHSEPWPIFPAYVGGDLHGVGRIAKIAAATRPEVILMVNDVRVVGQYLEALASVSPRPKTVAYMPVDSTPVPIEHVLRLRSLDQIVVYTHFAAAALLAGELELRELDPTFELPPIEIIPHGVDSSVFRPLFPLTGSVVKNRRSARRDLIPYGAEFEDAFIVLNSNRNQPRKRIDLTVAGFAQFVADKPPSVKLYLHMGVTDFGWDVRELARRHGISDRLMMTHAAAGPPCLSLEQLNRVYNACDVGLNTADAEGWGLASFEHAATGAAQVVPRHSGPGEIWEGAAEMLDPCMQVTMPLSLSASLLISPANVAEHLERLYRDPALLQSRSLAAYRLVTESRYSWDAVAERFDRLLTVLCDNRSALVPNGR